MVRTVTLITLYGLMVCTSWLQVPHGYFGEGSGVGPGFVRMYPACIIRPHIYNRDRV